MNEVEKCHPSTIENCKVRIILIYYSNKHTWWHLEFSKALLEIKIANLELYKVLLDIVIYWNQCKYCAAMKLNWKKYQVWMTEIEKVCIIHYEKVFANNQRDYKKNWVPINIVISNISKIIYILYMSQYLSNTHERHIYI